ncbi:plant basic secretory protein [Trichoderma barbatum]
MTKLPASTPLPPSAAINGTQNHRDQDQNADKAKEKDHFSVPAIQLQIRDLKHPGAKRFLSAVDAADCMTTATLNLLKLLYHKPSDPETTVPPTSSVTLILEDMPGVAYTVGHGADNNIKEIHFSLSYIAQIDPSRVAHEINGVVTHELVHCFQYNGHGAAPGGLIEGIADWVRLHCKLSPPHWKQEIKEDWDAGYQHTAYFLEYLEELFGHGTVRRINDKLREAQYVEEVFWVDLLGIEVKDLFAGYTESLQNGM